MFVMNELVSVCPSSGGDSDLDFGEDEDFSRFYNNPSSYSYLSLTDTSHSIPGGVSYDLSPLSSPEKEPGGE